MSREQNTISMSINKKGFKLLIQLSITIALSFFTIEINLLFVYMYLYDLNLFWSDSLM